MKKLISNTLGPEYQGLLFFCNNCRSPADFPVVQFKSLDELYFSPAWKDNQWSILDSHSRELMCIWAESEGTVESYILGELNKADRSFEIFKVVTLPVARRKSLATKLFDALVVHLSWLEVERVYLQVSTLNKPALGAYKKWGFVTTRKMVNYYGKGLDGIELIKEL